MGGKRPCLFEWVELESGWVGGWVGGEGGAFYLLEWVELESRLVFRELAAWVHACGHGRPGIVLLLGVGGWVEGNQERMSKRRLNGMGGWVGGWVGGLTYPPYADDRHLDLGEELFGTGSCGGSVWVGGWVGGWLDGWMNELDW